jgi:hypothetical protein
MNTEQRVSYAGQPTGDTAEKVMQAMNLDIDAARSMDLVNARNLVNAAIQGNDIADDHLPQALDFMQRSAERMEQKRTELREMAAKYDVPASKPNKSTAGAPAYVRGTGDSASTIASRFSFTRAICNVLEGRQHDGAEAEMITEGRSQNSAARGQIVVPDWGATQLRSTYGSNATSGSIDAAVTGLQTMAGAPLRGALHGQPLVERLGATIVDATGSNTVLLPWLGVTAASATDEGASASSTSNFQQVTLTPQRYTRKVTVSQLALRTTGNQGNMDAVLLNDMSNALATAQDKQAFAALQAAAQYAFATESGTNGLAATDMADLHSLVSKYMDVTGRNEYPTLIVSKLGAQALNTGLSGTDTTLSERYTAQTGARIIPAVNLVDGNFDPADIIDGGSTATIAGAGVAMAGDMASLAVARWGGFDLLVDVYGANADGHVVSLHANAYSAAGVLNNAFAQLAVTAAAISAS